MSSRKQIAELAVILASRKPEGCLSPSNRGKIASDVLLICRLIYEKQMEDILKRLQPISEVYGIRFEFGSDPSGYCLRIFAIDGPPIAGNMLGGNEEGYGI